MNKEDARVKNTVQTVRNVFLQLLHEKPLQKISVTEICTLAQINRTTFYKHYQDVYDLMDQTEQFILDSLRDYVSEMPEIGVEEALILILQQMKNNVGQYSSLFGPNGNHEFMTRLGGICYPLFHDFAEISTSKRVMDDSLEKLCYAYITSGCTGILTFWMRYHFEQEPNEIAALIIKMVKITLDGVQESF